MIEIILIFILLSQRPLPPDDQPPVMYSAYLPMIAAPAITRGYAQAFDTLRPGEAQRLGLQWYYDYGLKWPFPSLDNGAEYVPYFWCDRYPALAYTYGTDYFEELAKLPRNYSGYILILNEPDLAGSDRDGSQCERTPHQAAYIYKALVSLCQHCAIVGPAVSHEDYIHGWPWLREFYGEISAMGLRLPDVAAIHTYIDTEPPNLIIDSLFELLANYPGSPQTAWVTEFGTCNADMQRAMIKYYQLDPRVVRYAWFTAVGYPNLPCINLLNEQRQLTAAGEVWITR